MFLKSIKCIINKKYKDVYKENLSKSSFFLGWQNVSATFWEG